MKDTEMEMGRVKAIQLAVLAGELKGAWQSYLSHSLRCEQDVTRRAILCEIRHLVTEMCGLDGLEDADQGQATTE